MGRPGWAASDEARVSPNQTSSEGGRRGPQVQGRPTPSSRTTRPDASASPAGRQAGPGGPQATRPHVRTFPTTGSSTEPHVSAPQCTRPEKKSAVTAPATEGGEQAAAGPGRAPRPDARIPVSRVCQRRKVSLLHPGLLPCGRSPGPTRALPGSGEQAGLRSPGAAPTLPHTVRLRLEDRPVPGVLHLLPQSWAEVTPHPSSQSQCCDPLVSSCLLRLCFPPAQHRVGLLETHTTHLRARSSTVTCSSSSTARLLCDTAHAT